MDNQQKNKVQQYTVSISPLLHGKIEKHVFLLQKLLNSTHTKHDWLIEAIESKLSKEEHNKEISKEKRVTFRIDFLTKKKLEDRVRMIRRFRNSYSKRQWVLDAIQEKLDNEEEKIKSTLKEYHTAISNETIAYR